MDAPNLSVTDTEARLLDAAYQVFSEVGFRRATTRRIARTAGVNEVTLYRRYASKDALMVAAMEHQSGKMIELLGRYALPQTPVDLEQELQPYLHLILAGVIQARQAHRTAFGEWGHNPSLDKYLLLTTDYVCEEVGAYFLRAAERNLLRKTVQPEVAAQTLLGAIVSDGLMRDIMPARYPLEPEQATRAYIQAFLGGVAEAQA